jgi:flagellar protein FlgJ
VLAAAATAHASERLSVDVRNLQALRAAARQFEALMVQTMLKTMRETRFSSEGDPFADSSSLRMYRELLDQQWAQKMSEGRGLGFAEAMVRQLGRVAGAPPADGPADQSAMPAATSAQPLKPAPVADPGAHPLPASDSTQPTATTTLNRKQAFIDRLAAHAEAAARQTGVPAHFILGHAALESGWGAREITAADGGATHNLFGIKAGAGWKGGVAETLTTEYQNGLAVKRSERFRAYADYTEAFADYARLLKARYGEAVGAAGDARAFGQALATGGYATDPNYAEKLGRVIASVERVGT